MRPASEIFDQYAQQHHWGFGAQLDLLSAWFGEGLIELALNRLDEDADPSCFEGFLVENFGELSLESESDRLSIHRKWWWLAINRASCAAGWLPLANPVVRPTPEQLIGFMTQEEQLERQHFFLNAPIEEVTSYINSLPPRIKAGEVAYIRPADPDPPTRGETLWAGK